MIKPLPPYPAALLKYNRSQMIVVADLHIGWEMSLSNEGIHVPSQMPKLAARLVELVSEYRPDEILVLGDVKHTIAGAEKWEWHDVPDFFCEVRKHVKKVSIIRGNHDGNLEPLLPEGITLLSSTGVAFGDTGFFHGNQWPSPSLLKCKTLVMGHVHPVVVFRDPAGFRVTRQVWIKASCNGHKLAQILLKRKKIKNKTNPKRAFFGDERESGPSQLLIMPSFNDLLGGRPLNEGRTSGSLNPKVVSGAILRSEAVDINSAEAYLLDGTLLGTVDQLRALS